MRCIELIGKSKMYGFINKRYFKFYEERSFLLTERQFEHFCTLLIEYLHSIGKNIESYINQIERVVGMISFIPNEEIVKFYKLSRSL